MPGDNRKTIGKSTGAIRSAPAKQETPTRTNTGNLQRKARAAPLDTPRFASFVRQDVAVVIEGERDPLFEPFIAGQFIRAQRDKAPEVPPRFIEPAEFAAVQAAGHLIRRDVYLQFFTVHTGAKAIVHQKIQLPETDRFGIGGVFVRERLAHAVRQKVVVCHNISCVRWKPFRYRSRVDIPYNLYTKDIQSRTGFHSAGKSASYTVQGEDRAKKCGNAPHNPGLCVSENRKTRKH